MVALDPRYAAGMIAYSMLVAHEYMQKDNPEITNDMTIRTVFGSVSSKRGEPH